MAKVDTKYFAAKNQKSLGAQLRISRMAAQISNREMAHSIGLPAPTLSKWELARQERWSEEDCKRLDAAYQKMNIPGPEWNEASGRRKRRKASVERKRRTNWKAEPEAESSPRPKRVTAAAKDVALDDGDLAALLRLFRRGLVDEQVVVAALKGA